MTPKTGAARIALTTRCPVVPIAQWGPQELLPPYARRPRLWPRPTMRVTAGPPVDLSDLYDQPLTRTLLMTASNRIIDAITAQLAVLRDAPAPAARFDLRTSSLPRTGNPRKRK